MIKSQHTNVSPDALLKVIQRYYPSIGARECRLLALGCTDNFRIKGRRRDYVFRLYRLDWWPETDVDEELRFLEILSRRKVNVCRPFRTGSKQRYMSIQTPEGLRYGALFGYLPGRPLAHNFGKRNANMVQFGEMLGRVHTIADGMRQPVKRWTMGFDEILTPFFADVPLVLGHREKDITWLHKVGDRLQDIISEQPEGSLGMGLCHGDLHVHNVMLQPDDNVAIFDFDWCGYSWRAYDLATVWWSLPRSDKGMAPWRAFLRGYNKVRKLTRQEHELLPWFVVLREFELLNFQLSVRAHFGDGWLNDNYYDFHIGFMKNWLKQHQGTI